ncbi:unnamed protein product [Hyaloperonospora brassicae]|uniref:RxLR effector candidate protein n=1 Tax=Hyaloperonospora brassicae TaxID=162125 RepID=A0AAV0U677_HYABA|nr:unnamed protein product [Hyaloperonospora brassicae]
MRLELVLIFVLDVGYTESVWVANSHFKVTRSKTWLRRHSSIRGLREEGGKGVQRRWLAFDDNDYRDRGISRVTFIGRMNPETHHSKVASMINCLFNESADGT